MLFRSEDFKLKLIQELLSLRSGDEVAFTGKLGNNIGGIVPEIMEVEKLWCIRCKTTEYGEIVLVDRSGSYALESMKYSLNYLEEALANGTASVLNYTQSLFHQIQDQFNLSETVSAIADE